MGVLDTPLFSDITNTGRADIELLFSPQSSVDQKIHLKLVAQILRGKKEIFLFVLHQSL